MLYLSPDRNRSPAPHIRSLSFAPLTCSFRSSKRTPVCEKAETGEDEVLVDDYGVTPIQSCREVWTIYHILLG